MTNIPAVSKTPQAEVIERFSFGVIADTHVPETDSHRITLSDGWEHSRLLVNPTANSRSTLSALSDHAAALGVEALVHLGDISDHGGLATPRSYQSWNGMLQESYFSNKPFFGALGNHDEIYSLRDSLRFGDHHAFSDPNYLAYSFKLGGTCCLMLDAKINQGAIGRIPAEQLDWLREQLERVPANDKVLIFCHFPLMEEFIPWHKDIMLVENGLEVHQLLSQFDDRVLAIVSGHTHMSRTVARDGLNYMSIASSSTPFRSDVMADSCDAVVDTRFGYLGFDIMTIVRRAGQVPALARTSYKVDFEFERI